MQNGYPMAAFTELLSRVHLQQQLLSKNQLLNRAFKCLAICLTKTDENLPAFVNIDIVAKADKLANGSNQMVVDVKGTGVKNAGGFLKDYALYVYVTEDGSLAHRLIRDKRLRTMFTTTHSVSA